MEVTLENIYCRVTVSASSQADLAAQLAKQNAAVEQAQLQFDKEQHSHLRETFASQLIREKTILAAMQRLQVLQTIRT